MPKSATQVTRTPKDSQVLEKVGGFGDGYTVAASGVFPLGREEAFIEALDAIVTMAAA
jgi:hypothetical protein